MSTDFLGQGWKFPIGTDERGGIALSEAEAKIKESILIILSTAKGERVMRPDFGCDIHEFTFAVINTSTLTLIASSVKEALMRHEPRIELLKVQTSTDKLAGGILDIHLDYRIRSTNTEFNMVYPFYLKAGGE